ncbi:hypothetical protein ARAM_002653 [Aspergillus rambellii]|uniref:C6 transcription factor RegA n=1 Tax=Aspergillus rambellii TaxID=308745 RepID=A0A0F8W1L2_9EURO|nr:hypothetical protein ARAM_002653 [Aspergillus rambellii]
MVTRHPRTPSSSSGSRPSNRNLYQCGNCSQSYTRLDHLARHVRSHTQEKPYQCTVCEKRFGRIDLLSRHSALHSTDGDQASKRRRRNGNNPNPVVRASQACSACAEHHLRCDEQKPCGRCRRRKIPCMLPIKPGDTSDNMSTNSPQEPGSAASNLLPEADASVCLDLSQGLVPLETHQAFIDPQLAAQPWPQESANSVLEDVNGDMSSVLSQDFSNFTTQNSRRDLFAAPLPDIASGTRTPRGLITFGLETNLDLSIVDLHFLESYNSRIPFEFDDQTAPLSLPDSAQGDQDAEPSRDTRDTKEVRSIQRVKWRFVPAPQDHGYQEHDNLLLPAQTNLSSTPQSLVEVTSKSTTECLDLSSRDRILSIVLSQIKHPISAAVHSFPSAEFLDRLIRYYLTVPFSTAGTWIHRAGFRPKKTCPELLLSMAAAGAVLTPDASLRKLGFAMQEVVRLQLPDVFEANNTKIYNLELLQAYLMYLEVGLWSGNNRKIELSEGFRQPLITMVRRRGMFHHSAYSSILVQPDDTGDKLYGKWRAWIRQESYKRLAYHLFRLDAELSMALLTCPIISYAEFCIPLPAPSQLWAADSAPKWKELYCELYAPGATRIPALTECVANLDLLESSRRVADISLSCSAVAHALWGLVWEYRQLSSLLGTQSRYWDPGLLMMTRSQQLTKMLDYLRMEYKDESNVSLNFILMHMHMSLEEIQTLATSEDPNCACEDQPALRDWCRSKEARLAVWHAGQVVRELELLPLQSLRDFVAIALYHASLTLWAYGIVSSQTKTNETPQTDLESMQPSPILQVPRKVWLDGDEAIDVQRYISFDRGIPVLHGILPEEPPVSLRNSRAVLDLMVRLLEQNHNPESQTQPPPLAANLILILGKLRDVSK